MKMKKHSVVNNLKFLFLDIAKFYPLLITYIIVQCVCSIISPVVGIYLPKVTIDLVLQRAGAREIVVKLGGLGIVMIVSMAFADMADRGKYMMLNDMRMRYRVWLLMKSFQCDYDKIESVEGQTKYERAMSAINCGDASGTTVMMDAMISLLVNVFDFLIFSSIISTLHIGVVLFLIVLSLVNFFAVRYAQSYEYKHQDEVAGIRNKLNYIMWTSYDVQFGKDIRLYGMSEWLRGMWNRIMDAGMALNFRIKNRYFMAGTVNALTLLLRDGIAYLYLIWSVMQGRIAIGEFVLYFGAVTGFSEYVGNIIGSVNQLNHSSLQMNDLREFLEMEEEANQDPISLEEVWKDGGVTIDFEDVSFAYEKQEKPVLEHFHLHIERGEKIALVGLNGAGKTTVIKLLCGLCRPDSGRILINGFDIRQMQRVELTDLFSVIFQDISIFPFSVAENVSMQPETDTDVEKVVRCLKKVGLFEEICEYPEGIHSPMQSAIQEGVGLSGGQQQKLLMARALYKDAPVLVFDEPTAALDAIAESEIYQNFHDIAKNRTVVFISHRLASTKFCDRIVLLSNGKIMEEGTHEELLKKGNEYSRMYEIQSQYYKEGEDHEY